MLDGHQLNCCVKIAALVIFFKEASSVSRVTFHCLIQMGHAQNLNSTTNTYVGIAMVIIMGDVGGWDESSGGDSEDGEADD